MQEVVRVFLLVVLLLAVAGVASAVDKTFRWQYPDNEVSTLTAIRFSSITTRQGFADIGEEFETLAPFVADVVPHPETLPDWTSYTSTFDVATGRTEQSAIVFTQDGGVSERSNTIILPWITPAIMLSFLKLLFWRRWWRDKE
jgi:hypothetical protein